VRVTQLKFPIVELPITDYLVGKFGIWKDLNFSGIGNYSALVPLLSVNYWSLLSFNALHTQFNKCKSAHLFTTSIEFALVKTCCCRKQNET
jgi:hypothetical protein